MRSTNPRDVAYIFRDYARKIHSKAVPEDPSYLQISVACGKVQRPLSRHRNYWLTQRLRLSSGASSTTRPSSASRHLADNGNKFSTRMTRVLR